MADEKKPAVELKEGSDTSEFKVSKWMFVVGTVLELGSTLLEQAKPLLPAGGKAESGVNIALVVIGGLLQVATVLGYTRSRTQLKIAHAQANAATTIAQSKQDAATATTEAPAAPVP